MRIATWNMYGAVRMPDLVTVKNNTEANVICLQECGKLEPFLDGGTNHGAYWTGNLTLGRDFMECVYWPNINPRLGTAVLSNVTVKAAGVLHPIPAPFTPARPRSLPWMRVEYGAAQLTVFSIHSPPVWTATLADVCSWNNTQIGHVIATTHPGDWAVVGDFNADPRRFGFVPPPAHVVRGYGATQQGGGLLDYAVTNAHLAFVPDTRGAGSDHFPQVFRVP